MYTSLCIRFESFCWDRFLKAREDSLSERFWSRLYWTF